MEANGTIRPGQSGPSVCGVGAEANGAVGMKAKLRGFNDAIGFRVCDGFSEGGTTCVCDIRVVRLSRTNTHTHTHTSVSGVKV